MLTIKAELCPFPGVFLVLNGWTRKGCLIAGGKYFPDLLRTPKQQSEQRTWSPSSRFLWAVGLGVGVGSLSLQG